MKRHVLTLWTCWLLCWPCLVFQAQGSAAGAMVRGLVPLPPLAVVTANEMADGKTWMQEGVQGWSLEVVCNDFRQSMRTGGWSLNKAISMGTIGKRSELLVWVRGNQRVLVMIFERKPGLCGFTWGEEK